MPPLAAHGSCCGRASLFGNQGASGYFLACCGFKNCPSLSLPSGFIAECSGSLSNASNPGSITGRLSHHSRPSLPRDKGSLISCRSTLPSIARADIPAIQLSGPRHRRSYGHGPLKTTALPGPDATTSVYWMPCCYQRQASPSQNVNRVLPLPLFVLRVWSSAQPPPMPVMLIYQSLMRRLTGKIRAAVTYVATRIPTPTTEQWPLNRTASPREGSRQ